MQHTQFARQVAKAIDAHRLLHTGQTVLVGLSGGADSVALLLVLSELGYHVEAAHCNFHLRGADSDGDAAFVRGLCERCRIVLHATDFDTRGYAAEHHVSLEMAARDLRYEYFARLCHERTIERTAVAHHREDNVETIMLNLVRGTGLKGLCGMAWRRDGIIRPLLGSTRAEILNYLSEKQQGFVTDQTNLLPIAKRNVLRLEVLPLLRQLNPAFDEAVLRMADNSSEALRVCNHTVCEFLHRNLAEREDGQALGSKAVRRFAAPRLLLHEWLTPHGFNSTQLNEMLAAISQPEQKQFKGRAGERLLCSRRELLLVRVEKSHTDRHPLPMSGCTKLTSQCMIRTEVLERRALAGLNPSPEHAYVDCALLGAPLCVRQVQRGDRFRPFGMDGSKLVSDFLTDLKMPAHLRLRQWVVTSGEEIVWLVGLRLAAPFAIRAGTQSVLHLSVSHDED